MYNRLIKGLSVKQCSISRFAALANFSTATRCNKDSTPEHGVHYETSLHKDSDEKLTNNKSLPDSADVVVIGGGSVGCSTLYHLAKLNVGKVVLIEREKLTAGTTWHTGGILWNIRPGRAISRMQKHTRDLLSRILPEETGFDAGWIETGAIFITRRKEQLDAFENMHLVSSEYGTESCMVDVEEIARLHPMLNTDGILGGLYSPRDGSLDPATFCTSCIKAATRYGGQVFEKCDVTDIKTSEGIHGLTQVVAVETELGTIKTNNVVNCTGAWAPHVAKMVGVQLPQLTYKLAYVITQGLPGIEKCPHVRDNENGVYLKRQGDTLLFGGYEKNPDLVGLVEKDFRFGLYDMDWEIFESHMNATVDLIPEVEKVGIRSTVCGPESFTSDSRPLMGETSTVKGFFIGSAFNGAGMMMGGGAGQQLAHWVAYGRPEYDIRECDVNRYLTKYGQKWLEETNHEHFYTRYDVHHQDLQPLASRYMKTTPLTQHHIENGAYLHCIHGWEVPAYYMTGQKLPLLEYDYFGVYGKTRHENYEYREHMEKDARFVLDEDIHKTIEKEAMACYNSSAVIDLSHLSKFRIHRSQSHDLVRRLFCHDVTNSTDVTNYETMTLNKNGEIIANINVRKMTDGSYEIIAPSQLHEYILRHIYQFMQENEVDCSFDDVTEEFGLLNIVGPESKSLLSSVGCELNLETRGSKECKINGVDVQVSRSDISELPRYEIECSMKDVASVYESLIFSSIKPTRVGIRALNSVFMETKNSSLLSTALVSSTPLEAGLACPLDDDREFIGKTALLQTAKQQPISKLIHLTATSDFPLFSDDIIWKNDVYVGTVEEASYGYKSKKYHIRGFVKSGSGELVSDDFLTSGKFTVGRRSYKVDAELMK